jgi:hypothetical protein
MPDFIGILSRHNLVFSLVFTGAITTTTPLWEEADIQIKAHFREHQLSFTSLGNSISQPRISGLPFHQLDWLVMLPGRLLRDTRRKLKMHPSMSGNGFHQASLRHLALFPNPIDGLAEQPLIFLCKHIIICVSCPY